VSEYGALRIRAMLLGDPDAYRELMAKMSDQDRLADWRHLDGTICVAGHDAETDICVEGGGPVMSRLVWAEVERLQRYEAMWRDCRGHRDKAEKRARHYMEIVAQIEKLVVPDEDEPL
jgi:hypothetical protein